MKNKIVFIVPYYGKFPDYFQEWIYSAGFLKKENIDFLLISDIDIKFSLPENIHVLDISFNEFRRRVQKKFDFKVSLTTPYKLCDFKATLGYVFSEEIKEYEFWGNCDIDQVWGSIKTFISEDILEKYDRIQFLGHFILYRNSLEINTLFMKKGAIYNYKKVFSDEMHYSFCEHSGMMKIVVDNNISNYLAINYADLSPRFSRMIVSRRENYKYQIIYWENGHIYRSYINNEGHVNTEEFMYFHYQKKHPESTKCLEKKIKPKRFIYRFDKFIDTEIIEVDKEYIIKYSDFVSDEKDKQEEINYKKEKIKQFLKASLKKKILWIKQKIATKYVIKQKKYFGDNYSNI